MRNLPVIFFLLLTQASFAQQEKNFIDQNYIEVTGTAEMEVVPDLIYIKIKLSERDTKGKIPLADLQNKVVDQLSKLGIDVKKDLVVDDMLSQFNPKIFSKADITLSKQYTLVVHDAKTVNSVFAELEKIDISNVTIDHVDHSKITEFKSETRINAIKAAKDKADALTKAIGQGIGRAIFIEEAGEPLRQSNNYTANTIDLSDYKSETVAFHKIKLTYSIVVRFELK